MFKDYKIAITGATSGIGLSAARLFIAEGATVIGIGRNFENTKDLGERFISCSCDVRNPEQIEKACAFISETFGRGRSPLHQGKRCLPRPHPYESYARCSLGRPGYRSCSQIYPKPPHRRGLGGRKALCLSGFSQSQFYHWCHHHHRRRLVDHPCQGIGG